MVYSHITQLFHRSPSLAGTIALAVFLVTSPILSTSTAYAQEAQQVASAGSININTANAETLASSLTGVGISRAQEIVRHREAYGPFSSVDELEEVKGIGSVTVNKNRAAITLE